MKLALAFGAAAIALTMAAQAQTGERVIVRHGGHAGIDADNDGWISRAESAAAADRMFAELDSDDDGRLTSADRPAFDHEFEMRLDGHAPSAMMHGDNCTRSEEGEGDSRRVTVVCRSEADGEHAEERHVERHVTIVRSGHGGHSEAGEAPMPPHPPHPPHPPMFMMMLGEDSEADLNGDGAISAEEFRAQHLRMFDAHDANGDGRVRLPHPPAPPEPPQPPAPPEPPRGG